MAQATRGGGHFGSERCVPRLLCLPAVLWWSLRGLPLASVGDRMAQVPQQGYFCSPEMKTNAYSEVNGRA